MYSIIALFPCVADPSWSFSLRALYSASGFYQPSGSLLSFRASPLHGYSSFYHSYMCARVVLTLMHVACIAHFPGWLPNRFYFLYPLGFVIATGSALRPYGLLTALWALGLSGLSASPNR